MYFVHESKRQWQTSLVVQWIVICLTTQEIWIQSLAQEDSTCHEATNPVCHNYKACTPRAHAPQEKPPQWEACSHQRTVAPTLQLEKACTQEQRPIAAKNKPHTHKGMSSVSYRRLGSWWKRKLERNGKYEIITEEENWWLGFTKAQP